MRSKISRITCGHAEILRCEVNDRATFAFMLSQAERCNCPIVVAQARAQGLTSHEHFTVDGTLLEAWASLKSFQRKDGKNPPPPEDPGNPTVNFCGDQRSNETHGSRTDPDAKRARKSAGKAFPRVNGNLIPTSQQPKETRFYGADYESG
jgi:hypothetical protein